MNNKKAFKVLPVGNYKVLQIGVGELVCMARNQNYCDDPTFGRDFNSNALCLTEPTFGIIYQIEATGIAGQSNLTIAITDPNKNPILEQGEPVFETITATIEDQVGLNKWCVDKKSVLSICDKYNSIAGAEFNRMREALEAKHNHLRHSLAAIHTTMSTSSENSEVIVDVDSVKKEEPSLHERTVMGPAKKEDIADEYFGKDKKQ